MKSSKKITLFALMAFVIATLTFASAGTLFANGRGQHLKRILSELNLSSEQKDKIREIMKDTKEEHKDKADKTREEKIELAKEVESKIKAVLTPEQQKKFDELKAQEKEKMKKRRDI